MSDIVKTAVEKMNEKLDGAGFDGLAKFTIEDEGSFVIDPNGARESDEDADVTLTATSDTFQAIVDGDMDPTSAYMTGKLKIDGDLGLAMKLSGVLS